MSPESKWIGVFSALVLLIGIFLGIAMDRFLFRPPPGSAMGPPPFMRDGDGPRGGRRFMARLTRALNLTETQRGEIKEIFRRHLPRLRQARRQAGDSEAVRREMHGEIAKTLNPEQRQKFEALTRQHEELRRRIWERWEEKPPPPPGPE